MAMATIISRSSRLFLEDGSKALRFCSPASVSVVDATGQKSFSSTETTEETQSNERLAFSKASLGLDRNYIAPSLASMKQLPEIESAMEDFPSPPTLRNLRRAADVFANFSKGSNDYLATNAMMAECQHRQGLYDEAIHTLDELSHQISKTDTLTIANATDDVLIAKAKVLWTQGEFSLAQELCESFISDYNDAQEKFSTTPLHLASAMTGKALCQLAAMNTMDDAFSVRDYFRISMKFLERHPASNSLPLAAAHANCGAAEAIYNDFVEASNNVSVPVDAALKTWFQGLQKIDSDLISEKSANAQLSRAAKMLQATIQADLAWGVLNYEHDRSDRLNKASEYAKKALEAVGPAAEMGEEGIRRVLAIVASCYQQAGSAVTAEGLFQSATSRKSLAPGPLASLELQDALRGYSKLCSEWDKREGDAERLNKEASELEENLPEPWKGKSAIHSSLWFWTPADFH